MENNNSLSTKQTGIFYGYYIVAATFFCAFIFSGCGFYAFSLFITPLKNEFGWGRGGIMGALTTLFLIGGISAPVVGRLVDRYDISKIVAVGALLTGLGFILLSLVNNIWHFYAGYALAGIGMAGVGMVPTTTLISNWFKKRRGTAVGIMSSGIGAGGLLAPLIGGYLIPNFGWRIAYQSLALSCWLIIPLAIFFIRSKPEALGLYTDGIQDAGPSIEDEISVSDSEGMPLKEALSTSCFWLIAVSFLAHGFAETGSLQSQVPYLESVGFSLASASFIFGAVAISSGIGKFFFGWLCDRIQAKNACAIGLGFQLTGVLILINVHQLSSIISHMLYEQFGLYSTIRIATNLILLIYAIIIGLGVGSWLPAMSMLVSSNFGLAAYGSIFGFISVNMSIGGSSGPLVAGYIFDATGGYHWAFIACIISYLIAIPTVLLVRRPQLA